MKPYKPNTWMLYLLVTVFIPLLCSHTGLKNHIRISVRIIRKDTFLLLSFPYGEKQRWQFSTYGLGINIFTRPRTTCFTHLPIKQFPGGKLLQFSQTIPAGTFLLKTFVCSSLLRNAFPCGHQGTSQVIFPR